MRFREKSLAYALLRIAVGVNFAGHGLVRLYIGLGHFANSTAEHLSKSPLPHGFVLGFLYIVPIVEAVVGVALVLGMLTRSALVGSALLMIALTIGVTSNQEWNVAGQQLLYSFVLFVLLFFWEHNEISVDRLMRWRGRLRG
ncbi:MAG TPA: DoxX family protein [Acidobacteriaceae bacterium]|jgi:thiosulfate dehydrogenase [quinone] large subunit|nr:DoxX family protein [Acidobacteriaceae bacterium]